MTTGRINQVACDECCTPPARKRKHAQHKHGIRLPTRNPPITDGDRTIESCLSHRGATPRTERPTKWTTDPSKHHAIPDGRRSLQTECNAPKRRAQGHTSSDHSQMYHQCLAAEAHHSLLASHRIVQPNLSVQLFMRAKRRRRHRTPAERSPRSTSATCQPSNAAQRDESVHSSKCPEGNHSILIFSRSQTANHRVHGGLCTLLVDSTTTLPSAASHPRLPSGNWRVAALKRVALSNDDCSANWPSRRKQAPPNSTCLVVAAASSLARHRSPACRLWRYAFSHTFKRLIPTVLT
mmetsp:Transcript_22703/g.54643  ORF Transcript_22703/g.54643 Transcript_22703/m.54643 type:complete len:294 (+) Transcript_22703:5711-6592(+)